MSNFSYFSKNGQLLTTLEANVSLFNIEYSYGYGVYETLKLRKGIIYFVDQHLERLEHSAKTIGITIPYTNDEIKTFLYELIEKNETDACNIKIVLIGGKEPTLYIFASAPLYPDKKLYSKGASMVTYTYQRLFPTAKTLNMLTSYIAYKKAQDNHCYDSLFINENGIILEGTRTNFCLVKDKTIYKAPEHKILGGVTFMTLEKIAEREGFTIEDAEISIDHLDQYDGAFITSTSTKIMPVVKIDAFEYS